MSTKQLEELGLAIGALGGLVLAAGAIMLIAANRSYTGATELQHRREKWFNLLGSLLVSGGFVVALVSLLRR